MESGKYSSYRQVGREHVPNYPRGFIAIRIVQLVLALVILALCAYSLTLLSFSGNSLTLFTAVATMIITVYYIVVEYGPIHGYNYWAVLALDMFAIVFWIASMALLASQVAPWMIDGYTVCGYYTCDTYALTGTDLTVVSCLCAAAGLGGVEAILFIVALAYHSVMMHRHRAAGLHSSPRTQGHDAHTTSIPMGGPVAAEKPQPAQAYSAVPQPQYAYSQHTAVATPTPPPQGQQMYQPPDASGSNMMAQPMPQYPQQQHQHQQQQPPQQQQQQQQYQQYQQYQSPIQPQSTGASSGGAGVGQAPPPHPGSYEAQGQPIGYQQHY
ncbi:hypothetical protein VSDG_03990 [Cytospora chrysosperma]|uniref:MARVEL domain-containing protein n=1 Tax=Cytospora chrysosperma TaxID=252740 RepID=A0A423W7Q8_CYTCH|nr:hypothetical protein VSDG_03990 [Valsa sordida]